MDTLSPSRPASPEDISPLSGDSPQPDPASTAQSAPAPQVKTPPKWRTRMLMFGVPLAMVIVGGWYWLNSGGSVSTDNAYVQMDKVSVASEIGGKISQVAVKDGQDVAAGQLLFRIDSEPYRLAVAQADSAINAAQVMVGSLSASAQSTGVDIGKAREDIAFAESTYQRQAALMAKGFTTKASFDAARHAVEQARASLRQAEADAIEARAKLSTGGGRSNPQVEAARVQRAQAKVNLGRAEIRAPSAGRITQADRLLVGQMMVQGLPAVTLVDTAHPWVEANFKETDLAHMKIGQCATLRFDAYPGLHVKGHVAVIGAGTGSEFSLLPAQNATGNWVKVTQRVPVRIVFDEVPSRAMIAGLSTEVEVFTDGRCK